MHYKALERHYNENALERRNNENEKRNNANTKEMKDVITRLRE